MATTDSSERILVTKLDAPLGASVTGVDLSRPLVDDIRAAITESWHDNIVLVFPGQNLSGSQQIAFARLFGRTPRAGRSATAVVVTRIPTPLGTLIAGAADEGVCLLEFCDRRGLENQLRRMVARLDALVAPGSHPLLEQLERELAGYFAGRLEEFTVPLVVPGTDFQRAVWDRLRVIPYGETLSYEALARSIGRDGAQRAVGRANGDNRIAIVIPCHRVVRADGTLCGYGGGLWRKRHLLELEGALS